MLRKKQGFTLIELLVVIAIIGLLSTLAVVSLGAARVKARNAKRLSDLNTLRTALEMYYNDHQAYPNSGGNWDGLYSSYGESLTDWIPGLVPQYIAQLPRDPRNHTDGSQQYIYRSNTIDYKLISHVPEDCAGVKASYPNMIDPIRDCWAFGFWSPGGAGF
ncbi:MAG: prepilin-type N-terminal cleavage/methylation domain-containing protein [Patescibacteria group bacterium]